MIELYCCGPGLLFWLLLFQIKEGSWVFKVDSAKPCTLGLARVLSSELRAGDEEHAFSAAISYVHGWELSPLVVSVQLPVVGRKNFRQ